MIFPFFRRRAPPQLLHLLLRPHPLSTAANPPPIRITQTDAAGRGVFASRPIAAGERIHSATPVVSHPSLSLLHQVCYGCLRRKNENNGADSDSDKDYFCSDECREKSKAFCEVEKKADWSSFNEYCRINGLKYPLMVKRLACMVISKSLSSDCLDILQPAFLHQNILQKMKDEFDLLKQTFKKAKFADEQMTFLSKEWYVNMLARIRINAFRIELIGGSYEDIYTLIGDDVAVGNAVYLVPSFYNHDCDPNTHIVWIDNSDAKLKALRDIEEGEELRICYIDASMEKEARQKILLEGFGFQCNCSRCLSGE
ncbi:hypothetical protein LUZ60_005823 [Juncus effusus]|nr:hypothetical protein LUZ60_005823 [Juncus effusus]